MKFSDSCHQRSSPLDKGELQWGGANRNLAVTTSSQKTDCSPSVLVEDEHDDEDDPKENPQ